MYDPYRENENTHMSRVGKTIRQQLDYRPEIAGRFEETKALFNRVTAFYFEVIETHPEVLHLDGNGPRDTLERLTHLTKTNPEPAMPHAERLSKERGVPFPQAAESGARPPTELTRHGEGNGHGTAQG
jgi:hypothetical protein